MTSFAVKSTVQQEKKTLKSILINCRNPLKKKLAIITLFPTAFSLPNNQARVERLT